MEPLNYKILLDSYIKKRVQGVRLTEHFAAHETDGWTITHLPTGRCLVLCKFKTPDEARKLATWFEVAFGELLDKNNGNSLVLAESTKERKSLMRLAKFMNALKGSYTMDEIREMATNGNAR